MNERDPIEETIARFREITPPANVRNANRMAVRVALELPVVTHWWQRTVTLPLPAVLATAAALLLSLSVHLFHRRGSEEFSKPNVGVRASAGGGNSATSLLAIGPKSEYCETQRYLSGVGVIDRNMVFQIRE